MSSDPSPLKTGKRLGRYELLLPIARGGTGQVWLARLRGARGFHKLVAVKTISCAHEDEEQMERLLLEEARIASLIHHSNVVQTFELGEHEGVLYLVMEWVEGEPLSVVLAAAARGGGVPSLVAVNLIGQTLRGLQAAHEQKDERGAALAVVHRDISPHNVLVSYSGVVKVADFGIARAEQPRRFQGEVGAVPGKLAYMAPEQLMGGPIDQRTDLFAVGILLYLLTTGRHPFEDHAVGGLPYGIMNEDPAIRPSLLKPGYSRTLEAVVMKALDKDRDRRWPSAEEMRLALERGVPPAFSLGFEAQLRAFMADTVGELAAEKREALRCSELVADAAIAEATLLSEAEPTPSAGSLRAILIDPEQPARPEREATRARASRAPTLRPSVPASLRGASRRWKLFGLGAALSALLLLRLAWGGARAASLAASSAPAQEMVELVQPRGAISAWPKAGASAPAAVTPIPATSACAKAR